MFRAVDLLSIPMLLTSGLAPMQEYLTQVPFRVLRVWLFSCVSPLILCRSHTIGCSSTIVQPPVQSGSCLLANQCHQALITCTCLSPWKEAFVCLCVGCVGLLPFVCEML
ncbi:unnamed protein product [Gadus morhua 'NCC']